MHKHDIIIDDIILMKISASINVIVMQEQTAITLTLSFYKIKEMKSEIIDFYICALLQANRNINFFIRFNKLIVELQISRDHNRSLVKLNIKRACKRFSLLPKKRVTVHCTKVCYRR